jgi:hypothetical protein
MAKYSPQVRAQAKALEDNLVRFKKQQEADYDALVARFMARSKIETANYQQALSHLGIKNWNDAQDAGVRWEVSGFSAIKLSLQ